MSQYYVTKQVQIFFCQSEHAHKEHNPLRGIRYYNKLPLISRSLNFASILHQVHHVNKCSRVFLDLSLLLTATSYANVCNFHSCIT